MLNKPCENWQEEHKTVITSFLTYLNKQTDQFILKGGTALMLYYGLDRFSENIDFDGSQQDITEIVRRFCEKNKYSFTVNKDTLTVKRCMIDYDRQDHRLKIEVSYRNRGFHLLNTCKIANVVVYKLDELIKLKCSAYKGRDRLRDLYDLCFLGKKYFDKMSDESKSNIADAFFRNGDGEEYVLYLLETQKDPLIDNDRLYDDFMKIYEKLGFLENEKDLNQTSQKKIKSHTF